MIRMEDVNFKKRPVLIPGGKNEEERKVIISILLDSALSNVSCVINIKFHVNLRKIVAELW